ncbi:MAG: hypothetical protein OXC28_07335 [Defluviicoccus sp.]|nr:hypothetical protein [Defluviicoccus sp.]
MRRPAIKIAPHPGDLPSELRYRGRTVGAVVKLASGGVRYRAGWQMDAFQEAPRFPDFHRLPAALRRDRGPFRSEKEMVRRLEAAMSGRSS